MREPVMMGESIKEGGGGGGGKLGREKKGRGGGNCYINRLDGCPGTHTTWTLHFQPAVSSLFPSLDHGDDNSEGCGSDGDVGNSSQRSHSTRQQQVTYS